MIRERGHLNKVQTSSNLRKVNVMTLGESGVGKSCLVKRFCEGKFVESYISTIGIDYGLKTVTVNQEKLKVNFWDTAGDSIYLEIRKEFYKDVNGLLLVCDQTERLSFQKLENWINEFRQFKPEPVPMLLAVTKSDLNGSTIQQQELDEFSSTYNIKYFYCSSFNGDNVNTLFNELFALLIGNTLN